jgi:Zn-dependent peptidase ImmA (M78 family)
VVKYDPSALKPFLIVKFLEEFHQIDERFAFEILSADEISAGLHAQTIPSQYKIQIREDVYDNAVMGEGRDRMTIAHEFGHYFLHQGLESSFMQADDAYEIKPYEDPEWQAKAFAGELLIPYTEREKLSVDEIVEIFKVSEDVASYQKNRAK